VEEIRNIDQVQQLVEESLWFAQVARLLTYVVNSKKQASKELKKITLDAQ
jgi:hypothetical protein